MFSKIIISHKMLPNGYVMGLLFLFLNEYCIIQQISADITHF